MAHRKIALRAFLFVLVLLGAGAVYLTVNGPGVIIDLAKAILKENGLPEVEFSVGDLSLETVTLEGIRIGEGGNLKIPRISAVFSWRELIDGEVGEISIDNLELTVHRREQGLSFGELDAFVYGTTAEPDGDDLSVSSFHWPFRKLSLGNARITLLENDTPFMAMTIDGAVLRNPAGGLNIGPARISATSPEIDLTAAIAASLSDAGILATNLELEHGAANLQGYQIVARDGSLTLNTPLDNLSALQATGRLSVNETALPLGFATTGDLNLSVRENRLKASVHGEDQNRGLKGEFAIEATFGEPLADQPVKITMVLSASDAGLLPEVLLPVAVTHGAADLRLSLADTIGNLQFLAEAQGLLGLVQRFPALTIEMVGRGIGSPALPGRADIRASLRLARSGDDTVSLYGPDGITATLSPDNMDDWAAMLGLFRQSGDVSPLVLSVLPVDGKPLLEFHLGEVLQKSRLDALVRMDGGALPPADARLIASTIVDPNAGIFDVTIDTLALSVERADVDAFTLSGLAFDVTADATEKGASGSAELSTRFSGGRRDLVSVPGGQLHFPINWQYEPGTLELSIRDCAGLRVPEIFSAAIHVEMQDVKFCLRQDGRYFLRLQHSPDGIVTAASLNAGLSPQGRDIVVTHQDGWRARLNGKNNKAKLHATVDANGVMGLTTDVALGTLILPSPLLQISDIQFSALGTNLHDKLDAEFKATAKDLQKPRRFAPLDIAVQSTMTATDTLTATGSITAQRTPLKMEWEAKHTLSTQKGRASARVKPFEFGLGANSLSDITGILDGIFSRPAGQILAAASAEWSGPSLCGNTDVLIRQASAALPGSGPIPVQGEVTLGQMGLTGKLCMDEDGIQSQAGQLLLDNMEFAGDQISAKAVNANIDIANFLPFATAPDQVLSVGVVDLGFPLTDGLVEFSAEETSRFNLDALAFNWIGGKVSVAPFVISPTSPLRAIDLSVEGARLEELTELVPDKGVTGEGVLDGALPIRLTDDGPAVENGFLEGRGPGVLRYSRTLGEDEEPSAVDDVLSNLQYSKLRIEVDGGLSGGVRIGLHVEGSNPEYLDGYPVVLDVNVNGPLGAIMNDGLATYKVPAQIMDRMRRFGQLR